MSGEPEQVRRRYHGREIDPVEAFNIHMALQELRETRDAYLEVEIDEEDSAARVEANCRAIAAELELPLQVTVAQTRHVRDSRGRLRNEPAALHITVPEQRR